MKLLGVPHCKKFLLVQLGPFLDKASDPRRLCPSSRLRLRMATTARYSLYRT